MTARATETAALSKIVRIMMSVALLVGMCASAPMQAQASESAAGTEAPAEEATSDEDVVDAEVVEDEDDKDKK